MTDQDNLTSIALEGIERHSKWLQYSSREVVHFVHLMNAQRPFLTKAEDEMQLAEKALVDALEQLRTAKANFESLPK